MWKKIGPLMVMLSISLNAVFVGTWVVQAAREGGGGPRGHGQACEGVSCPLHRSLGVTDEQWGRLEPRLSRFLSDSESLCRDIRRARGELIDLMASALPDRDAIRAKQEEILSGQRGIQDMIIAHLLAQKRTLTEEQQAKLFQMIRERSGCAAAGAMMFPVSIPEVESRAPGEPRD